MVLVTCPTRTVGETIAAALVRERLAACVNVVPAVTSIYWWEGRIRRDAEVLLLIKTRAARLSALVRRVTGLHPYTVPEIVSVPVAGGSAAYLSWVRDSTS